MEKKKTSSIRMRLSPKEAEGVLLTRGLDKEAIALGKDPRDVKHGWIKTKTSSLHIHNPNFEGKLENQIEFKEKLIESLKNHSPTYPKIKRTKSNDGHLLVIDIADLHINKYADKFLTNDDYNSEIAVNRALEGTKGLLQKAQGFNIEKILFVIGNDILNTDNANNSTTRLTPQNTDKNFFDAFNVAKDCYVACIEMCMSVADVDVLHCISNHDMVSGCFLAETLSAWFRKSKNVTFDTSPKYRKYYKFHSNLLMLSHGDKGKLADIPMLIATEQPQMWADTKFRYGFLHHIHHHQSHKFLSGKDFIGINITYLRSPSSADLWHFDNGFLNMVACEGFLHSQQDGRVAHLTHYF